MKAYQLKIQIKNSHPPIWRRVIVPAGLSFSQLSIILNEVMGWCGYHLSAFEFYHLKIRIEDMVEEYDDWGFGEYDMIEASETMIDAYLDSEEWFTYQYDFGDDWQHRVTIEKVLEDYDANYAQVLKYKGDTPYEDCGGIWRYYELLEILKDPQHPEYEDLKAWTDGHFTMEYDLTEVNQRLRELYLSDEVSEPMTQNEIYEEILGKRKPFKRILGIREIGKPTGKQGYFGNIWDKDDYVTEEFDEAPDEVNLKDILSSYQKHELTEIAKIHHLSGYTKYNKSRLCDFLCDELLDKDVMLRYFKYLSEPEIKLLEAETAEQWIDVLEEDYDYLLEGGYAGYSAEGMFGTVVIPLEVKAMYKQYCDMEWKKMRKENISFLQHLNAAVVLSGICPVETVLTMYRNNTEKDMDELSMLRFCAEVPENKKLFYNKSRYLLLKALDSPEKEQALLEQQQVNEYYMPTLKEVECFYEKGFFPFDRNMKRLQTYLVQEGCEEPEDAEAMCGVIQNIIRAGGSFEDIMAFLEDNCLDYELLMENESQIDRLIERLQSVWNSTRMILNRGFTPDELEAQKNTGKNHKNNIISFSKAKEKKIYPNDPCPCGSGKKYKHCCGKK